MGLLHKITGKRTFEEKESIRMEFLKQLLELKQVLIKRPEDYAKKVANDFYLDSVVVTRKDGSIIMSNRDERNTSQAIDFLNLANTKYHNAHFFLVKEDGHYNVIYSDGDFIYTFRSPGEISVIEAKTAAKSLKGTIDKYRLNKKENKILSKVAM